MRLLVVVEGQTEEAFVNDVLQPHLGAHGVYATATIVGKMIAQRRGHRGRGGGHFRHWRKDIERLLLERSSDLRVTTLFDLYELPHDFPGWDVHGQDPDSARRCERLEAALQRAFDDPRLLPYIQRHEFEALVLASLPSLRGLLDAKDDIAGLTALEQEIGALAPEDVNDGPTTAPSKRLIRHVPGFSKALHGPLAAADTGLAALRDRCPRFSAWLSRLEGLAGQGTTAMP